MAYVIRIISKADETPSECDGQWVMSYDAHVGPQNDGLISGYLITTPELRRAKKFATQQEALECYGQQNGLRPDGKPNRPMTAFTVCIESI